MKKSTFFSVFSTRQRMHTYLGSNFQDSLSMSEIIGSGSVKGGLFWESGEGFFIFWTNEVRHHPNGPNHMKVSAFDSFDLVVYFTYP